MTSKNNIAFNDKQKMSISETGNNRNLHGNSNEELNRLQTFSNWTNCRINIHELAQFGFYFTGINDLVKCAFCGAEKSNWIVGDDPLIEHIRLSPKCPLLLRRSRNIAINSNFNELLPPFNPASGEDEIKLTGIDVIQHPNFRSYNSRYESFKDWPKSLKQTAHELSDAGYFYMSKGDQVKCFCCSNIIENWDAEWNVWEQHVHRSEDCYYVQLCKTPTFIKYVRAKFSGKLQRLSNNQNNIDTDGVKRRRNKKNNSQRNTKKNCNICFNEGLNSIFLPCMHIYTCIKCGFSVTHCPVCRQKISDVKKCFIF